MNHDPTPSPSPSAAVLIADDDESICFSLARLARRRELVPLVAGDGVRAAELAEACPGRVIGAVLDVNMPRAGGLVVAARLVVSVPGCPVVLMTGHPAAVDAVRRATGIRAVLEKPFDLKAFDGLLASFLDESMICAG